MAISDIRQAFHAAFMLLRQGAFQKSEVAFRDILTEFPASAEARYGLAYARAVQGAAGSAHEDLMALLKEVVDLETFLSPEILFHAAVTFIKDQKFALAAKALHKALAILGRRVELLVEMARCELALGNNSAALDLCNEAFQLNPGALEARLLLASALERQGKLAEAIGHYEAILSTDQNYPRARSRLAFVLSRTVPQHEALGHAEAALSTDPSDNLALFAKAKCLTQNREWAKAEAVLLTLARTPAFLEAGSKMIRGKFQWREDAAEHIEIVRAFWPLMSDIASHQGWFEKALTESQTPVEPAREQRQAQTWTRQRPPSPGEPHVVLVTYGSEAFRPQVEGLATSAITAGEINEARLWTSEDLKATHAYRDHATIFDRPRGNGYWAWKSFLIFLELSRRPDGDTIIYYDCGRGEGNRFTRSVRDLVDWCTADQFGFIPGVSIPFVGANKFWTKRDCFHFMGCDTPEYWNSSPTSANLSVWRNSPKAREFVCQWMTYCLDPRIISDAPNVCGLPNHDDFLDHRQDQSILSNLVVKHGIKLPDYHTPDINGLGIALQNAAPSR